MGILFTKFFSFLWKRKIKIGGDSTTTMSTDFIDMRWLWKPFSELQEALEEGVAPGKIIISRTAAKSTLRPEKINDHVYEVHKPAGKPSVELVFFHGLQLEPGSSKEAHMTTWVSRDKSEFWLTWLLEDIPEARVLTISYDAAARTTELEGRGDMYVTGENLVHSMTGAQVGQNGCPVVLVGHCLGGLIIKEVCCRAFHMIRPSKPVENFLENLKGFFFYATPHHGSLLADYNKRSLKGPLIKALRSLEKHTARRNEDFRKLRELKEWKTFGVGELLPVKLKLLDGIIVPEASARSDMDSYYGATADHYNICRPEDKQSSTYKILLDFIHQIVNEVPPEKTQEEEAYYWVPYLPVENYVERIDLLESVTSAVQQRWEQRRRQVVVLLGMGGQGKSQLAMEYCREAKLSKKFRAIFWIDASSIKSAHRSFERIAAKIADQSRIFENIEEKVAFVKDMMDGWDFRWLLVFDNYNDPSTDFNLGAFFPNTQFGTILVTSRHEDSKRLGKVIPLAKMTEQESLQLLFHRSENEFTDRNMETGRSIVAKLEFLPLAIDQAGAFIGAQKLPLNLFLEHFDSQKEKILKYTPSLTEYKRILGNDEKETALNVFTTWELSFQQIPTDETGERLRSFLTTAAFFNSRDIGEDLFHGANELEKVPFWIDVFLSEGKWDSFRYREALVELSKLSLLNFAVQDTEQCRFYLHPLIADWLRLRVGPNIRGLCTIESCYLLAKLIESTDLHSCGYAFRLYLLGHVDDCLNSKRKYSTLVDEDAGLATILACQLGGLFMETTRFKEGISLLEEALPIIEDAYGKDHLLTFNVVHNLGLSYDQQGKLVEAEEMYERAFVGSYKALGKDHASTLHAIHNLGSLYHKQGKLVEAEEMFERALAGREKALGKDHASTLDTVNNLGILYREQGKLVEAEEMFERALPGKEKALGKDHASTLGTLNNLGSLYYEQGKLVEAEEMFERALAGNEKALGKDHVWTLHTVHNLGLLYGGQGKLVEAEEMYERALAGNEKALGKDHVWTLHTVHNLGILYHEQGKLVEAEEMFERALAGSEKALGKDHALTLDTVHNLGCLYAHQGKLVEAEEMYERALAGNEKALGKDHASTLSTINNLGNLYTKQKKLVEAKEMYERALAGREKALGKNHASTLRTVNSLGILYSEQGKLVEAEEMYERALAGSEKALGKDHASTLSTINNLGNLYYKQGKLVEAEKMYERALVGIEKALGKDHALTLNSVNNLGNLYTKQGKLVEAEEMYKRALAGYEKALGRDHEFTLDTVCGMAKLMEKQENLKVASQMFERAFFGYTDLLGADNFKTIQAGQQRERISHLQQKKVYTKEGFWKRLQR